METKLKSYPKSTGNRNVPKNTFIIGEIVHMNGEIIETYYATEEGNFYKVTDWIYRGHIPVDMKELFNITGEPPDVIENQRRSFYKKNIKM